MKFKELLKLIQEEPIFSSSLLMAGKGSASQIRMQLSRWVAEGKIIQIKRGLYAIANPYRNQDPHSFLIANMIKKASYISLQSALEYYGIIPEYVPKITNVTTGRPGEVNSKLGVFIYRHLKKDLFWGYQEQEIIRGTNVFIARPEKALLDLIYLTSNSDNYAYIGELRLQNSDKINIDLLMHYSKSFKKPKMERAANLLKKEIINRR